MNRWMSEKTLDPVLKEKLQNMSPEEQTEAFHGELAFGTGGMRGIVGPGTNRMNKYVLRRTNYGFANYLLAHYPHPVCVIAYDSRHYSKEFAMDSACVLASLGVKTYVFRRITPTPELSFAVRALKASGGIVITASHNPPQYNGYKVYDEKGCQLVPGLVESLSEFIAKAPDAFAINPLSWAALMQEKMIEWVSDTIDDAYLERVLRIPVHPHLSKKIKVIYTPLHGTGGYLATRILDATGYQYETVAKQMIPDPEFSTVKSPNPENVSAFTLAVEQSNHQADILVATDPDADRIGIAVLDHGDYRFLTGNQTGALLIDYLCRYRYFDGVVFNTIVTSELGAQIARRHGLRVISTLTGFKYIGEQAGILEHLHERYFFGYEESYGYLIEDFVRDKDSLQSMLLVLDMANFYHHQGKTLVERLDEIYQEYGYYLDHLVNIQLEGVEGSARILRILDAFRTATFPFEVVAFEDYLNSVHVEGTKTTPITLPKENVLKFFLKDGSWFVVRPSGTEPKMKLYFSIKSTSLQTAKLAKDELERVLLKMVESVL